MRGSLVPFIDDRIILSIGYFFLVVSMIDVREFGITSVCVFYLI